MNLKYAGILTAFAVSAVMAQDATPVATAPTAPSAPVSAVEAPSTSAPESAVAEAPVESVFEDFSAEPAAVRGADAAQPVKKKKKKFVYRPVYSPSEIESRGPVKTIYVSEAPKADPVDMDQLRGLIPLKFTFGLQGFIGSSFLSGDNGRYEYDRYSGLTWNIGAFALFPLDEYNMAFKTGVLFEHDKVSNSYNDYFNDKYGECRVSFSQYRISVPLLLSLKSARSNLFFDVGVQPSFAVADKFRIRHPDNTSYKEDMMEEDYRQALDWSIVLGFGIRANRYIGFDARFSWGLNNQYDDYNKWPINNLSSKSVAVGATFYVF